VTRSAADDISTIAGPTRAEIDKIKGSRFICDLAPAGETRAALEFVERVRASEPDATHHCWAFRLGSGGSRSSDDGEPGGTAGPPILRRLVSADLVDVVAVVTRYYGGTNLGTGGLIRAYGSATAAAIEAAVIVTRRRMTSFIIDHPYDQSASVARVLAASDAQIVESTYDASVTLEVRVPATRAGTFPEAVRDETAGKARARERDG